MRAIRSAFALVGITLVVGACQGKPGGDDTDASTTDARGVTDAWRGGDASLDGDARFDGSMDGPDFGGIPDPPFNDGGADVPHPDWGPTEHQAVAPPPLSGGTLLVARDGHTAVAADPDRDRVVVADLANASDVTAIALDPGDEPGRLAEDAAGRVHVALRRGHALVTVDLATRAIVARRAVCPEPRGVAYDAATDLVHVACVGGELVSLPAAGGAPVRTLNVGADLRDVVVQGDSLLVSTFRSAHVLEVLRDGTLGRTVTLPFQSATEELPDVAWRLGSGPAGSVMVLHQLASRFPVPVSPGGYGGLGRPIVRSALSTLATLDAPPVTNVFEDAVLAIDFAVSPDGAHVAVVAPGNWKEQLHPQLFVCLTDLLTGMTPIGAVAPTGAVQAIAVAYDGAGRVIVQAREPSALYVAGSDVVIPLGGESRADTGHTIFHSDPGGGLACASCHPEGRDDGRVWTFMGPGQRRTQFLAGGVLATAPFHWGGEFASLDGLLGDVFTGRMSGGSLTSAQTDALGQWLDALPRLTVSPPADPAAVARGDALFHDPTIGCTSCHAGALLTNNANADVGTGGAFQVPSLRDVAFRAPYMHTGCAATLRDRFDPACGGTAHGNTASLTDAQRDDLIAYLQTL